jgi:hypothetical protein
MCLDIGPARKIEDYPTLGEFLRAVFGKDTKRVPVATVVYEYLPLDTPVESLQCPHVYSELVRSARSNCRKSNAKLELLKAQGRTGMEALKNLHQEELVRAEMRGFHRGLEQAEKSLKRKLLVEASAAHLDIKENLSAYTDGIRIDLGECIEFLEQAPDDRTSGAYIFIMELSKRFTKRLKVYSGRRPPDNTEV